MMHYLDEFNGNVNYDSFLSMARRFSEWRHNWYTIYTTGNTYPHHAHEPNAQIWLDQVVASVHLWWVW